VEWPLLEARTGWSRRALSTRVARAVAEGLLEDDQDGLRPTPLGLRFLNDLLIALDPC
jgi:coproporphyrinogen III oxidase-like Fe-S oxidoreductase